MKLNFKLLILTPAIILAFSPGPVFAQRYTQAECAGFRERGMVSMEPYCTATVNTPPSSSTTSAVFCRLATNPKLADLLNYATCTINRSIVPLIFALAVVSFVYGVVQYVINSDDEAKKIKGREFMIWGIIALAVMVSVWGLVRIVGNTFGIEYAIPQVKSSR